LPGPLAGVPEANEIARGVPADRQNTRPGLLRPQVRPNFFPGLGEVRRQLAALRVPVLRLFIRQIVDGEEPLQDGLLLLALDREGEPSERRPPAVIPEQKSALIVREAAREPPLQLPEPFLGEGAVAVRVPNFQGHPIASFLLTRMLSRRGPPGKA
jgi:hypothetical protein